MRRLRSAVVAAALAIALSGSPLDARAKLVFDERGRIIELACDPARIADDERVVCGADAPTWANIHDAQGRVRRQVLHAQGRPIAERRFDDAGVEIAQAHWNAKGEKTETEWYPNHVVARQEWPAVYEGAPARMIQEYWDDGQIRSRGTIDARGRRLGLFQTFHRGAGLATESYYVDGRLVRRREFDDGGRLLLEEDYADDGSPRTSLRR
ncbi:MAG: hypothetical protein QM766_15925 [Burkholderiaceae bacterium]